MRVIQGVPDIFHHTDQFAHGYAALQARIEITATDVLQHQVEQHFVGTHIVNLRDVGMFEPRVDARFLNETLAKIGVVRVVGGNHLQCNQASKLLLQREIHAGHSAVANLPLNLKAGQFHYDSPSLRT